MWQNQFLRELNPQQRLWFEEVVEEQSSTVKSNLSGALNLIFLSYCVVAVTWFSEHHAEPLMNILKILPTVFLWLWTLTAVMYFISGLTTLSATGQQEYDLARERLRAAKPARGNNLTASTKNKCTLLFIIVLAAAGWYGYMTWAIFVSSFFFLAQFFPLAGGVSFVKKREVDELERYERRHQGLEPVRAGERGLGWDEDPDPNRHVNWADIVREAQHQANGLNLRQGGVVGNNMDAWHAMMEDEG